MRATQEGIEYVCWSASFSIKDALKARGWQFSREVYPPPTRVRDLVALCRSARPGWRILFRKDNPNFQEAVLAERDWIRQNGWTLEVLMPAISLLSAPVEGRADLIT